MDITGITGASAMDFRTLATQQQTFETETNRFQTLLDQAIADNSAANRAAIREAAQEFESFFLQMMFREMRRTTFNEQSFMPKSNAEKIFTDMLDEEVSRAAASSGGIGLADMIYRQMTQNL